MVSARVGSGNLACQSETGPSETMIVQVPRHDDKVVLNVLDAFTGHDAGTAHQSDNFVTFREQELSQAGTILALHTGDKGSWYNPSFSKFSC